MRPFFLPRFIGVVCCGVNLPEPESVAGSAGVSSVVSLEPDSRGACSVPSVCTLSPSSSVLSVSFVCSTVALGSVLCYLLEYFLLLVVFIHNHKVFQVFSISTSNNYNRLLFSLTTHHHLSLFFLCCFFFFLSCHLHLFRQHLPVPLYFSISTDLFYQHTLVHILIQRIVAFATVVRGVGNTVRITSRVARCISSVTCFYRLSSIGWWIIVLLDNHLPIRIIYCSF
uniref:Uncharacterized protein n=1 Tax=Cacopsylla melanoneura TaxID=428564 RepID=A0A8D8UG40_9HEMI